MIITESEMSFGSYPDEHCFYIETSKIYQSIEHSGVKTIEFLLFKQNAVPSIYLVEAKLSSPQPTTLPRFDNFIDEIRDKFKHSLALFIAIFLKRHNDSELSNHLQNLELSSVNFVLVLVIKNHKTEWLPPLQEQLREALRPAAKIWNLKGTWIQVLNEEGAKEVGLITEEVSIINSAIL
jgi:hypothetical protein